MDLVRFSLLNRTQVQTHKDQDRPKRKLKEGCSVLALRVTVVSGPPDFVVAVVLVALGADVVQVAIIAPMSTRRDTLGRVGAT